MTTMTSNTKAPTWGALVRYIVCIVAVSWVVWSTDWGQLREVIAAANWRVAALGVLVFGPAPVLIAIRLQWLLAVHDVRLTAWQAIKVTFAGNFITNALPFGTGGGDAVKAFYIARDTPHKHEAVITILFDRAIGVSSLLALAGFMVLLHWDKPEFAVHGRAIGAFTLVLLTGGMCYYSRRIRRILRLDALVALLPLAEHLQRIDRALFAFRHRKRRLIGAIGLTFILQVVSISSIFVGGWALGLTGDAASPFTAVPAYLAYTPICLLAGALPLGVMEELFKQLLSGAAKLGPAEAAVLLSLFCRFTQLAWALPGALVVLKAGRPRDAVDALPEPDGLP